MISAKTEIEKYLENQHALDKDGKPHESLFRVKMYKSLKAAKNSNKLYSGSSDYYGADGGTSILLGNTELHFRSTEDE